jgi:hypothetical protein
VKALIESGADVNLKDNAGLDHFNLIVFIIWTQIFSPTSSFDHG